MADFETKKINELTEAAEVEDTDLTVTGDPGTGVLKKISILNFATSIKDKILGKSSDIADIGDGTVTGAIKQLDSDISDTQEITTDAFDVTKSYAVGDYCIYDNTLYKFKEEKSAGEWDEEAVEKTNTMTVLNSALAVTTNGSWKYRVMGGYADLWANISFSDVGSNTYSGVSGWYYSDTQSVTLPLTLSDVIVTAVSNNRSYVSNFSVSNSVLSFRLIIMNSMSDSYNVQFNIHGKVS